MTANGGESGETGTYEQLQRGLALLGSGNAAAAAVVLERVAAAEPRSASVLEALARAQFSSGRTGAAVRTFGLLAEVAPDSDYARFGYGLALRKLGRWERAAEQLALAVAMAPGRPEYVQELQRTRRVLSPRADRDRRGRPAGAPRTDIPHTGGPEDGGGAHDLRDRDASGQELSRPDRDD